MELQKLFYRVFGKCVKMNRVSTFVNSTDEAGGGNLAEKVGINPTERSKQNFSFEQKKNESKSHFTIGQ